MQTKNGILELVFIAVLGGSGRVFLGGLFVAVDKALPASEGNTITDPERESTLAFALAQRGEPDMQRLM
ncbi:hypothetical protein ACFFWD_18350 [Bradyrhizobium erythrophlei]|uniref:hypothetical protein n=1 Tax=Bradyrhizobium erythrophlei TaxID=1437360 RepID=UPI0035E676D5